MTRLAHDYKVSSHFRLQSVRLLIEKFNHPATVLAELCKDPANRIMLRLQAGVALGELEPQQGATALIALADSVWDGSTALRALEHAAKFDPSQAVQKLTELAAPSATAQVDHLAATAMVNDIAGPARALPLCLALAEDKQTASTVRFKAAKAVLGIDRTAGIAVTAKLACDGSLPGKTRMAAADHLARYDLRRAIDGYVQLCTDRALDADTRIGAGKAAGSAGVRPLVEMSQQHGVPGQARLSAATAVFERDRARGIAALASLASQCSG